MPTAMARPLMSDLQFDQLEDKLRKGLHLTTRTCKVMLS